MHTRAAIAGACLAAIACGGHRGGGTGPRPPDVPAASWSTAVPPFRLPANAATLWVDDRRAVISVGGGVIAAVDLATGAVTSKATPAVGDVERIARLADGRLIAVAEREARLRIYTVADDLGLELLREDPDDGWDDLEVAVAGDGKVAMSGTDHALQLYAADATTAGQTLSATGVPDTGWSALYFADGDRRLLGKHAGMLYSFDLATGTATELGGGTWYGASTGTTALAVMDGTLAVIDLTTGGVTAELASRTTTEAALSRDGTRAARFDDGAVLVHDTATRAVIARFALDAGAYTARAAFTPSGQRLVITTGAIVRVVDLAAGTITSRGDGPYRSPTFLAVTRDHVIAGGDRVRRWPVGGGAAETIGPDDPDTTDGAVSPSGELVIAARALPKRDESELADTELTLWRMNPAPVETARWLRHDSIASVALDDDGQVLVGAWQSRDGEVPGRNVVDAGRARGGWKRLIEVHYDGYVDVIDPVTRLAIISRAGAVRLIQLPGLAPKSSANIPMCDGSGNVHLDGAARRIATDDDKTVWVWDVSRSPGKRIAAGGFTGRVGEIVFVPGTTELVMDLDDRVAVWDYAAGRATSAPVNGIIGKVALDPAATRVAVGLTNGRILVFPMTELRAGTVETISAGSADQACDADPLAAPGDRAETEDRGWGNGVPGPP